MCGICGFAGAEHGYDGEGALFRMTQAMRHRGPDEGRQAMLGDAALGFRRLAILDPTGGQQPVQNEDASITSVCNGEIYNYPDLRALLETRGHTLRTHCDSEIVPHLYEEFGDNFVTRLRGMFAIALWDARQHMLLLYRDHFGIKPLYYAERGGGLLFASEIRALIEAGVSADVDLTAIWHYLSFQYVPDPLTPIRAIRRLPPGHALSWSASGGMRLRRYFEPEFSPDGNFRVEDTIEELRERLRTSVHMHMASDVPIGAYLSSGVDSTAVVALMRERGPVRAYSIGFPEAGDSGELRAAEESARLIGADHEAILIDGATYRDAFAGIVRSQEEPLADPAAPALYFLAERARRDVRVILSGEGADEVFCGYPIYREAASLAPLASLPAGIRHGIGALADRLPEGVRCRGYLQRGSLSLEERFIGSGKAFSEEAKADLLPGVPVGLRVPATEITAPYYGQSRGLPPETRMQHVDLNTWLPGDILMKADKMSMAHSIELRVPFLDVEVFSLAARIPPQVSLAGGSTKRVLRAALAGVVPEAARTRRKLGFPVPFREWLRGPMRDYAHDVIRSSRFDALDRKVAEKLLSEHVGGRDRGRDVWTVLTLLVWHEEIVGRGISEESKSMRDDAHVG